MPVAGTAGAARVQGEHRYRGRAAAAHPAAGITGGASAVRSERERLLDILEAIERIEKYASRGKEAFLNDELLQN